MGKNPDQFCTVQFTEFMFQQSYNKNYDGCADT